MTVDTATSSVSSAEIILGLDIGASKVHGIAVGRDREPLAEARVPVEVADVDVVADAAAETISRLVSSSDNGTLAGIGIGIPGRVDPTTGVVRHAINIGVGDEPFDLTRRLGEHFHAPSFVENDVNAAALGAFEITRRSLDISSLTYLSIGSGIAAGVILNGDIYRGSRGVVGEIGHFPMAGDGPECVCGIRGCLESFASGKAIERAWPSRRTDAAAKDLFAAFAEGQEEASMIVAEVAGHLARAVHLLAVTYDTDITVIGGGVASVGRPLLDAIVSEIDRLGEESEFVASLDLGSNLTLEQNPSVGAVGAATVAQRGLALRRIQ